jgi:uncharacterized membrane protein
MKNILLWMSAYTALFCFSQVILKLGLNQIGGLSFSSHQMILSSLIQVAKNPFAITGTLTMILAATLYLFILSWFRAGIILPLTALSYVLTAVAANLIIGEGLGFINYLGIALIALGINFLLR